MVEINTHGAKQSQPFISNSPTGSGKRGRSYLDATAYVSRQEQQVDKELCRKECRSWSWTSPMDANKAHESQLGRGSRNHHDHEQARMKNNCHGRRKKRVRVVL